ncbi:MAG: PHP domain-containing protein [Christensenellaceae bacterium]|nr:PHP domain-containing protein [Christensenellaceae bacterium]
MTFKKHKDYHKNKIMEGSKANEKQKRLVQLETHSHTAESSGCGRVPAEKLAEAYAAAGYHTLVVTDHYYQRLWDREELEGKSWPERVDFYLLGYRRAKAAGDKLGIRVLLATEIQFDGTAPYDFLIYGMDEQYILEHPYLNKMRPEEFFDICNKEGFLMIHAHPYRKAEKPYWPICYHGVEIFNAHPRHDSHNQKAVHYAFEHGLLRWSGSDYHQTPDCGRGGILCPPEVDSIPSLIAFVKEQKNPELIITFEEGED